MKGKSGKNNATTATTATTTIATATATATSLSTSPEFDATTPTTTPNQPPQPTSTSAVARSSNTTTTSTIAPTTTTATATATDSATATSTTTTTVLSQQDVHPYARGSVIEVWHSSKNAKNDEDDWWTDDEDDDDEDDESDIAEPEQREKTILLCDIIDRVPTSAVAANNKTNPTNNETSWRYYVHYRHYNRRMDEWIPASRIVSPPSVGNAKVRALKKQEMMLLRNKRKQQQQQATTTAGGVVGSSFFLEPKMAVMTSSAAATTTTTTTSSTATTSTTQQQPAIILDRRTRRRKSTKPDADEHQDGLETSIHTVPDLPLDPSMATIIPTPINKQNDKITTIPDNNKQQPLVTTTIQIGEHVVATVQAIELDEHEGMDEASLREHEEVTKIKNVGFVELGRHQMETWYYSPLPKEIINGNNGGNATNNNNPGFLDVLYVCEFTLRMFARKEELQRHQARVPVNQRHPPGNEIYRHENLAMFEVDGCDEKIYCQNLCYIAKLFLDHKTLYFDVDPFLFYVLCELDERGYHPVGYFSKEKYSDVGYNLACILSFPAMQRKGYGRCLIAFSYELTKKEEKVGSPEKPMSDLGQQAYKPYWASTIIDFLLNQSDETSLSIMDISKRTSIMSDDIVFTLNQLGILKIINGVYFIAAEQSMLIELAKKYPIKEPRIDPSKLHWTPYLTDIRRDKFSIHSKKQSLDAETTVV